MQLRPFIFFGIALAVFVWTCAGNSSANETSQELPIATLIEQQCGRCHAVPKAEDLDQATWQTHVLPRMGYFMGIYDDENPRASLMEANATEVVEANIFPEQAMINAKSWQRIKDYFLQNAPAELVVDTLHFTNTQAIFSAHFPSLFLSPPGTLLTRFSPSGGYFTADVHKEQLLFSDQEHNIRTGFPVPGGVVDLQIESARLLLTSMGSFSPTDVASGSILALDLQQPQPAPRTIIDKLQRPVQTISADLNADGRNDLLIPEFGKWTGGLSWWEQQNNGTYTEHELRRSAGALRVATTDLNGDQQTDIIALFGQGDEGFWAFYNQGGGQFREELLFRLPPSYGSSFFTVVDWNEDGKADILYTNGDNADYSPILKPYHGIRLYLQHEDGTFKEEWFQALPGAYQARAADFDLDGDLDLIAISFFPDYGRQADQSLVLFENEGNANFIAKRFAQAQSGRWITMDVADNDQDGDTDILLGSMAFEVIPPTGILDSWMKNGLGWVYLENLTNK